MEQRISVLTIAADNLSAMREFYEEKLSWKPVAVNKDVVFYQMNGFLFSITGRESLAGFIGVPPGGTGFRGVTFGYNVTSEAAVTETFNTLKAKGVKIIKEPTVPPFGGLFFYFEDVEGNILEVAFNSYIPLDEKGNATGHASIDHL